MKKILKSLLVVALLLVQVVPMMNVKAEAGTNSNDGTITINNAVSGQDYSIYQILVLESYDTELKAYTYKTTTAWNTFMNSAAVKDVYVNIDDDGYVTWIEDADEAEFARLALAYAKENNISATKTSTATSETVEFTGLNLGYYLVDSSLGALCGLTTTQPNATVNEKNAEPTVEKEVEEDSTKEYGTENSAEIGQVVNYKTTITTAVGAENYVLYDIMEAGLTFDATSVVVKNGDTVLTQGVEYTLEAPKTVGDITYTFVITFDNDYVLTLDDASELVVTYSAKVNANAEIEDATNDNETFLKYGDKNETQHSITKTYVYEFDLVKTNTDDVVLEGAEFEIYRKGETTPLSLVVVTEDEENNVFVYRLPAEGETGTTTIIKAGKATIIGLDLDTYTLKEETAPDGYNKLSSTIDVNLNTESVRVEATVTDGNYVSGGVEVENRTGSLLPETGGIGTVLFITIGSLMVLGFGVLLVTKLRLAKEM